MLRTSANSASPEEIQFNDQISECGGNAIPCPELPDGKCKSVAEGKKTTKYISFRYFSNECNLKLLVVDFPDT